MTVKNYTRTDKLLPPEGKLVWTLSNGGQRQKMILRGNLWFPGGGDVYAYYTPEFWWDEESEQGDE